MAQALYFFCRDSSRDPVAGSVFDAVGRRFPLRDIPLASGETAKQHEDSLGNRVLLVPTDAVFPHRLDTYLERYGPLLTDSDVAAVVNWHQGASAPERIFCVHSNGDVASGVFPIADAKLTTALLRSLEHHRRIASPALQAWRTLPEATHTSATMHGVPAERLLHCPCPLLDVEIGSVTGDWHCGAAHDAMAAALLDIHRFAREDDVPVLFVGGIHFEPSVQLATLGHSFDEPTFAVAHVLPNQWISNGKYDDDVGVERLIAAVNSIRHPLRALAMHDGLSGTLKGTVRRAAERLGLPLLNHRRLRAGVKACGLAVTAS